MGYWFVAMVFLWGGVGGLPLSAEAARFGLRFARDGAVVAGRIVAVERGHRTVPDSDGTETTVEFSSPVVAFRTVDGREMRESAIVARARTMAGHYEDWFVAVSQRGQWQGRTWTPGGPSGSGIYRTRRSGSASRASPALISSGFCRCRRPS